MKDNVERMAGPSTLTDTGTAAADAVPHPRKKKVIRPAREKHWFIARCEYVLFLALFSFLRWLSFPVAFRVGEWIGRALYLFDWSHRRTGLINLAIAFPNKSVAEHRAILRESLRNLGRTVAEFCHMYRLTPETIQERITFTDHAQWQEIVKRAQRTGAVILTAHFGNWELLAYSHAHYGFPVHIIHRRLRNPLIDEMIVRERERSGNKVIHKTAAGIEVFRALRHKAFVAIAVDQNASGRMGIFVPFFARLASTSNGIAGLALASGVPVIPAFPIRENGTWRHRIVIGPLLEPVKTGNQEVDVRVMTEQYTAVVQQMIEQYPDHWLWIHQRWKRRPDGEAPIY
ncbi:MAG: lysophospholipid acyltransferase family protein [Candidatus Binatia bacterium]